MPAREVVYRWEWSLEASPEALWPLVSDTNRFNAETGVPAIEPLGVEPGGRRRLRLRAAGRRIDYVEEPFEWVRPKRFAVLRRYGSGPLAELRARLELEPRAGGGSRLVYEARAVPRGLFGPLVVRVAIGRIARARMDEAFRRYDRIALGTATPRRARARLASGGPERLERRKAELGRVVPGRLAVRLASAIEEGDDIELSRMRPYELAHEWGEGRRDVLELCLHATRAGMLESRWELVCPSCRGAVQTAPSLAGIEQTVHCESCQIDASATLDRSASFQPPGPIPPIPPVPQRIPAKPGKVFQGTSQSDIAGMFKRFDQITPVVEETLKAVRDLAKTTRDLVPQFQRTNDEIRVTLMNWGKLGERLDVLVQANQDKAVKALDSLTEALGQASKMFSEENQRNLNAMLRNVREGTDNLGSISKNTEELIKRVQKSLEQADQVMANLNQATKPFAERGERITKNLEESTERLNAAMNDVRELLRGIGRGEGTFQRFFSDPALYQNLNDAAFMLTRLLPRVERILKDAEVFADKIARHPESLGIRGAVSPSSGLKESPGTPLIPPRHP